MLPDYHLHTEFSGDSEAPVRSVIEQAISLGMTEICITDHHDYDYARSQKETAPDFVLDFNSYFQTLSRLREEYRDRITIGIGVELGLQPHLSGYCASLNKSCPFDFIIGSTHCIRGLDPYYPSFFTGREEYAVYTEYFREILSNIRACRQYDVVGHIDYIVRYGPNKNKFYQCSDYRSLIDEILWDIICHGKGIECNTAGLRQGIGQTNPHPDILRRYRELGGEIITIGSDAHKPEDVGAGFTETKELLIDCGFRYYTVYRQRKPSFHLL